MKNFIVVSSIALLCLGSVARADYQCEANRIEQVPLVTVVFNNPALGQSIPFEKGIPADLIVSQTWLNPELFDDSYAGLNVGGSVGFGPGQSTVTFLKVIKTTTSFKIPTDQSQALSKDFEYLLSTPSQDKTLAGSSLSITAQFVKKPENLVEVRLRTTKLGKNTQGERHYSGGASRFTIAEGAARIMGELDADGVLVNGLTIECSLIQNAE